jgi:3-deoxy-7-phosphoheptulonate synthase
MVADSARTMLEPRELRSRLAAQQPQWEGHPDLRRSCETLASSPALVTPREIAEVRRSLAVVAAGDAQMLQVGDCAESFDEVGERHVRAKVALLHALADELTAASGQEVLRMGRLGGQFAKPRSEPIEHIDGIPLPVFRGHMVNSEKPTLEDRAHDPRRMVRAYAAGARVLRELRADREARAADGPFVPGPWASHDALVIDYEANLVRTEDGTRFLGSTHLPWIGDRTRQPDSAHVHLLSTVVNPVALKVGPSTDVEDLRELCALLDPDRMPGRLTLIVRMGAENVAELLPRLVSAVRAKGHPVVWLCDPMHGNTIRVGGVKTRRLADVADEAARCKRTLDRKGAHPGGLHVEVATSDVTECLGGNVVGAERLPDRYTTLCDPRLNPSQAAELLDYWVRA